MGLSRTRAAWLGKLPITAAYGHGAPRGGLRSYAVAMLLEDWLRDVWSRTRTVWFVRPESPGGALLDGVVLAELVHPADIADARRLLTTGRSTGICRCHGSMKIILFDEADEIIGDGAIHGHGSVSWRQQRFREDLDLAESTSLTLFLAGQGINGLVSMLHVPLVDALGCYENHNRPQFRPARRPAELVRRQVPDVLRPYLLGISGDQARELPEERVHELAQLLVDAIPDPIDRAYSLLNWLGRLPYPTEAQWGEGALVRRLLGILEDAAVLAAAAAASDRVVAAAAENAVPDKLWKKCRAEALVVLGALNWVTYQPDDLMLLPAVRPALHRLLT